VATSSCFNPALTRAILSFSMIFLYSVVVLLIVITTARNVIEIRKGGHDNSNQG